MTTNGLHTRLARLERRRLPAEPDPRVAEEAHQIVMTRILALAAVIEPGEDGPDLDVMATIEALARSRL